MNKQAAEQLITNTFDYPFDIGRYKLLSRNIFKEFEEAEFIREGVSYIPEGFRSHIKKYERLGKYEDAQGRVMDILIVYINEGVGLDKARTLQRNFIANYLDERGKDAALVAFTASDMEDWRFSLITIEYKTIQDESGKVKTKKVLSNAKRFSFLVGKNEANHTAQQQVIPLLTNNNNPSIEDLEQSFSVEQVTNEFYQEYKKRFLELGYEINRVLDKDEKIKKEFAHQNISTDNFAKKLIGQIVFLYFVQKKGWLGVVKDDNGNFLKWGEGDKKFMRSLFEKKFCEYDNYFNDVLEPLFYEALATERANNYYSKFECKIPFLSGGLFEPMNGYNWQETDITISNNVIEMILDTFDRYNFTVKEDDPLDKEVAIDPEMLGKVFENLLPENLKKGKGAFYTPRSIVHYMCQESLIDYLNTHLDIDKKDITLLIKEGEAVVEHNKIANFKNDGYKGKYQQRMPNSIIDNATEIDELLTYVKICDPAIGSGAFPMGLLHEIVAARNVLTNYIGNEYSRSMYKLKSDCIQNSIYGVDIDEGAIEISKLRLWLSIIVDEDDINNIKPLPNLDYKILHGNSLISRYELDSPINDVFSEFNKKVKSKNYNNTAIRNLVGTQQVDLKFYKKLTNDFLLESSHNKKILFRGLIEEIKNAFKVELEDKDKSKLSEIRGTIKNLSRIDIFGNQVGKESEISNAKKRLERLEKQKQEIQDGFIYKNAVEWRIEFPNLLNESGDFIGFDIVIANPPYITYKGKQEVNTDKNIIKYYQEKYKNSSEYKINSYALFLEKTTHILKERGSLIYIIPGSILHNEYLKKIRKYLLSGYYIQSMLTFGNKVFNAVTDSLIISIKKEINNENTLVLRKENLDMSEFEGSYLISQREWNKGRDSIINLNISKSDQIIIDKIEADSILLGEQFNVYVGIVASGIKKFLSDSKLTDLHKKYLQGKHLENYNIKYKELYINFLKEELHSNTNEDVYNLKEKLLLRKTGNKLICSYDNAQYFTDQSIYNIYPKNESSIPLKFLLACLNSTLLEFYFNTKMMTNADVFPYIKGIHLKKMPIKNNIDFNFEIVVNRIIEGKKNKEDTTVLEDRVDVMIFKLYELTYEEVLIVDESFAMTKVEYNNFEL